MKMYTCPSDPRGAPIICPGSVYGLPVDISLTSYLGNAGQKSAAPQGGSPIGPWDGVLYANSKIRLTDIQDGTSNTILVGERPPSADLDFGWWFAAYGWDGHAVGDALMTSNDWNTPNGLAAQWSGYNGGVACDVPLSQASLTANKIGLVQGKTNVMCDGGHYWSFHTGGALFLMGDGSCRFVSYSAGMQVAGTFNGVAMTVIACMSTRSGNEVYTLN